jgi:hypothetical protein
MIHSGNSGGLTSPQEALKKRTKLFRLPERSYSKALQGMACQAPLVDTCLSHADTCYMLSMFVPGRAKDGKKHFYCNEPDCSEETCDYPDPTPICPLCGVPMKQGKK